jgi:hypothetical protein
MWRAEAVSSLGGSGAGGDAPVVGVSGHGGGGGGGGAGMTSRVAIVSFPPACVNLHALLLVRVRNANRQYGLLHKRRGQRGDNAPRKIRDNLPQPRLIAHHHPHHRLAARLLKQMLRDRRRARLHELVRCAAGLL